MIANPAALAPVTKDELLTYLTEEMSDGATPLEAAREAAANLTFDEDLHDELVLIGISRLANLAVDSSRHSTADEDPKLRHFQRAGMTPAQRRDVLDRVMMVGADGVNKRLLDFTLADCERTRAAAAAQSAGWQKREESMGVAVGLLNLHKADKIGSLPAKALATLRVSMTDLWR